MPEQPFDPYEILRKYSPAQLNQIKLDALKELASRSLHQFIKQGWRYMDPANYVDNWHVGAVCEHLQAVSTGQIRKLIINQPPRTMKSLTVACAWPAWSWAQKPEKGPLAGPGTSFMFASYAQNLSVRDSVKCRRLIESPWYQDNWGRTFSLTSDQNTKIRFDNSAGGYRLATSVGGYLTGEGASVIVSDDAHNTVEAESELVRQGVLDWWDEALSTRLNDPKTGAYVIVMQRLHENDLVGHILERAGPEWEHLMLPMRFDTHRVCVTGIGFEDPRTEDGELLWPERFGEPEVTSLESTLGPYATAGQLQQSPSPRGGGIIKREWWQVWPPSDSGNAWIATEEIFDYDGNAVKRKRAIFPDFEFIFVSLDSAYTEKEENDPSACTVWGVFRDKRGHPKLMLVNAWKEWLEFHDLVKKVMETCKKRGADAILVEAKASGLSVTQELKRLMKPGQFAVYEIPVTKDKVARMHSVVPSFSGGIVYAPGNEELGIPTPAWVELVISDVASFPRGKHDDICFPANTKIATPKGDCLISELRVGDSVMTPYGPRLIAACGPTQVAPVIERFGLRATPNHPVFTFDKGFIRLDTVTQKMGFARLNLCDLIRFHRQSASHSTEWFSSGWADLVGTTFPSLHRLIERLASDQRVYTLPSGSIVPGRAFRRVMRSIISTAIPSIAALKIWSAYRLTFIGGFLSELMRQPDLNSCEMHPRLQWRGTSPTQAENGTERTPRRFLQKRIRSGLSGVFSAGKILLREWLTPSFAATTAMSGPAIGSITARLESKLAKVSLSASSAEKTPRPRWQGNICTVDKTAGLRGDEEASVELVYNLTVEGAHCYYADGVLVHNCDTVSQALHYMRRAGISMLVPEAIEDDVRRKTFKGNKEQVVDLYGV